MSEYTGLLLDRLVEMPGARIINIGAKTAPESVLRYYSNRTKDNLRQATVDFVNTTVLPKRLKQRQPDLHRPVAILLHESKILFVREDRRTMREILLEAEAGFSGNMGLCANAVRQLVRSLISKHGSGLPDEKTAGAVGKEIQDFESVTPKLTNTAVQNLSILRSSVEAAAAAPEEVVPQSAQVGIRQIVERLNDPAQCSLVVLQAHDPDALRDFAARLTGIVYESRRTTGRIIPLVSFIFDEADEFIPGQPTSDSQKATKAAAMALARRGRKFGLGIGIATQRIRYLDTSILAQPHTCFVSKLPRLSDRQAIAEAFGISEDMFRQTFKFKKGDWLLASYDAAGLEAIPIPIHTDNADDQILSFVERMAKKDMAKV